MAATNGDTLPEHRSKRQKTSAHQETPRAIAKIHETPLDAWDKGVFSSELIQLGIALQLTPTPDDVKPIPSEEPEGQIHEGTWGGTEVALTEMYDRIEQSFTHFFASQGIETSIPQKVKDKHTKYVWSDSKEDNFPPHIATIPKPYETSKWDTFNNLGLLQAIFLVKKIVPTTFLGETEENILDQFKGLMEGNPQEGANIAAIEKHNQEWWCRKKGTDIMQGKNLGDLPDWWSDSKYAQQQFTGPNPTTITLAGERWTAEFKKAAQSQDRKDVIELLESVDAKDIYVQDCSYFREAINYTFDDPKRSCEDAEAFSEKTLIAANKDDPKLSRWACAPVTLFQLCADGQLHPLSVIIDYKGNTVDKSVVIFNQRLTPIDPKDPKKEELLAAEKADWPWRYAKTCAASADWVRHEVTVHLVNTHLVEETVIVASNRIFDESHPVFRILQPHWFRTLSINAGAREVLFPAIIFDIIGFEGKQPSNFTQHAYDQFHFTDSYVPNDLPRRGFPLDQLDSEKFKNYVYAKNINTLWWIIRAFVESMIGLHYESDESVANDPFILPWCKEIQTSGRMPTFPTITTLEQLIDAMTMCIHLASPQHTAVNYLQNYYQAFVIGKPPALCKAPPISIAELEEYSELELMQALPIARQREWLLAEHIPWLLSFRPGEDNSLMNYAKSLYNLVIKKREKADKATLKIASKFHDELRELHEVFQKNSDMMTEGSVPYTVLSPADTAVSVLI